MPKKVFVSGCYDLLHSGHVEFFKEAAEYGDLYVGIGSDATILDYKHHKTVYSEKERLFMVKSIRYVKGAFINSGRGVMDFIPTVEALKPDVFVVNEDGSNEDKRLFCSQRGIEYVVLKRLPSSGLDARSSTDLKKSESAIPVRLDLAGTWIDQPSVSCLSPGWALTVSLEPTFEIRGRCGLSTSTRNAIRKIWPYQLPNMDPEMLAKLVFCFENDPERSDGVISGAQDAIGICYPGLCRHFYDSRFWPDRIETCSDEKVLSWLENHICLVPMFPRRPGCSVVEGRDVTLAKVQALTSAADACWSAILQCDLGAFAAAFKASFDAQVSMFPGMINPSVPVETAATETAATESVCGDSVSGGLASESSSGGSASGETVASESASGGSASDETVASESASGGSASGETVASESASGGSASGGLASESSSSDSPTQDTLGIISQVDGFLPTVQAYLDVYSKMPGVLAWKMPGAGGGGYLALVCSSRAAFPAGSIEITIRRGGM